MRLPTLRHAVTWSLGVGFTLLAVIGALALWSVLTPGGKKQTPTARAPEPGRCPNETAQPTEVSLRSWTKATICLVNAQRVDHGLRPLTATRPLARAGRHHAASMDSADYFSHDEPNGSTVARRAFRFRYLPGKGRWKVGEDLAWGRGNDGSPRAIVAAWMKSPAHRREILTRSYRNIAVGVVRGAPRPGLSEDGTLTIAAEFGHR